jgi:GT2 family glycosyltransferase
MALLICAVYDTETNDRARYTKETLMCLRDTVDFKKHRVVISDNGSCAESVEIIRKFGGLIGAHIIHNGQNLGTAKAVNKGIALRNKAEHCIKFDNDIRVLGAGWVDQMEEAIERDPKIGVLGLKRKDLVQTPWHEDPDFKSELILLPHDAGQRWITVEKSRDIMGTCTMLNWRLIDRIGGYAQPLPYAFDDTLINLRSILAGFYNAFLNHIEIEHLDDGANPYSHEKHKIAADSWPIYHEWHRGYIEGTRPLYEQI